MTARDNDDDCGNQDPARDDDKPDLTPFEEMFRDLLLRTGLPLCPERRVHGARVWLREDLNPWEDCEDFSQARLIPEYLDHSLADCVENIVILMDEIEEGNSPVDCIPDFDLKYDVCALVKRGGHYWMHCFDHRHHGRGNEIDLLVYALDTDLGWAVTLHGVHAFDRGEQLEPPVEHGTLLPNEPYPTAGGL